MLWSWTFPRIKEETFIIAKEIKSNIASHMRRIVILQSSKIGSSLVFNRLVTILTIANTSHLSLSIVSMKHYLPLTTPQLTLSCVSIPRLIFLFLTLHNDPMHYTSKCKWYAYFARMHSELIHVFITHVQDRINVLSKNIMCWISMQNE